MKIMGLLTITLQSSSVQTLINIVVIVAVVGGFAILRRYVKRICNNKLNKTK